MKKFLVILVLSAFAGSTFAAAPTTDSGKPAKTKKVHHKKHAHKAKTTDSAKAAK